jgi:hypothetical protein
MRLDGTEWSPVGLPHRFPDGSSKSLENITFPTGQVNQEDLIIHQIPWATECQADDPVTNTRIAVRCSRMLKVPVSPIVAVNMRFQTRDLGDCPIELMMHVLLGADVLENVVRTAPQSAAGGG